MSSDNIGYELDAVIRNRRKYASFWDWPDKKIKEWDVVEELLKSMHATGNCRYKTPVESVDNDPPDCVIRDSDGVLIGVEVTEFVDQDAVAMNERDANVYREWTDEAVQEKIAQVLADKDAKVESRRGLYGKVILVIHTDEIATLQSFELFPILDASHFPRPQNIDEAYLICSYEPGVGYPYVRLNLDGQSPDSREAGKPTGT
jgi:hypothetical protein